ncbi:hypothetical protein SAMN04488112_105121 [Melghirimyces thermohalophilus]|uniref:Uncharacterized protein n=1 Tax=Melghirimyces thermohalophilus TaxID=1236220 RepID=A0A1G6K8F9_9BACL|nr:hypothetical protein SAMN04488112_105121 [Melghirimyces thermohalophilus]
MMPMPRNGGVGVVGDAGALVPGTPHPIRRTRGGPINLILRGGIPFPIRDLGNTDETKPCTYIDDWFWALKT